jgi:zinc transporter 1/2/3
LIHLLQPANQALSDPCLGEAWQVYPYAFGICLLVIFITFFMELISLRYLANVGISHNHGPSGLTPADNDHHHDDSLMETNSSNVSAADVENQAHKEQNSDRLLIPTISNLSQSSSHYSHNVASQLGAILFLEFGIIFHSVFVGLTLAVSGSEFTTLYIVLVFHQLFEGLGLGTRIAVAPWPQTRQYIPWLLGLLFGVTTPLAIAIGLGIRNSYPAGSRTQLITNGIFDSISSGILLYTGLVELIANEFLHSKEFNRAPLSRVILAYGIMCLGAGLMALLGRWA